MKTWKHSASAVYVNGSVFLKDYFDRIGWFQERLGDFQKDYFDRIRYYSQEKMMRQEISQKAQAGGSEVLNLTAVGIGRTDLKSVWGVESSEFGCHVTLGTRGERRVKGIAEALTWVTQKQGNVQKAFGNGRPTKWMCQ